MVDDAFTGLDGAFALLYVEFTRCSIAPDNLPTQSEAETEAMPRSNHRSSNAEVKLRREERSNATQALITDPQTRLYKKSPGTGALPYFTGLALMEVCGRPV